MTAPSSPTRLALGKAEAMLRTGSLADAGAVVECAASESHDPFLLVVLGALRLALDDPASAHASLRTSLCLDPTDVLCRHLYALCLRRMGRHREAVAQLRICLEDDALDVDLLMGLSLCAREIGDMDTACQTQDRALKSHARDPDVWAAAADLARSLGQDAMASTAERTALTLADLARKAR
jgi:protein O-GlcNAc transferase